MKTKCILSAIVVVIATAGCNIKEDMTNCADPRGNVRVTLSLDGEVDSRGGLADFEIENSHVHVFDENGSFVTCVEGGAHTGGKYEIYLTLESGEYSFVVWTNEGGVYKTTHTGATRSIDGRELCFDHGGEPLIKPIPDLLYGAAFNRTIVEGGNNDIDITMTPNSYTINIVAREFAVGRDLFETYITNNILKYDFHNTVFERDDEYRHIRQQTITDTNGDDNGRATSLIRVLNLSNSSAQRLTFRNATTGNVLFDESLIRTINDAYTEHGLTVDFAKTYKFDIELTFGHGQSGGDDAPLAVTVSVNGWEYTIDNTDLE